MAAGAFPAPPASPVDPSSSADALNLGKSQGWEGRAHRDPAKCDETAPLQPSPSSPALQERGGQLAPTSPLPVVRQTHPRYTCRGISTADRLVSGQCWAARGEQLFRTSHGPALREQTAADVCSNRDAGGGVGGHRRAVYTPAKAISPGSPAAVSSLRVSSAPPKISTSRTPRFASLCSTPPRRGRPGPTFASRKIAFFPQQIHCNPTPLSIITDLHQPHHPALPPPRSLPASPFPLCFRATLLPQPINPQV